MLKEVGGNSAVVERVHYTPMHLIEATPIA